MAASMDLRRLPRGAAFRSRPNLASVPNAATSPCEAMGFGRLGKVHRSKINTDVAEEDVTDESDGSSHIFFAANKITGIE